MKKFFKFLLLIIIVAVVCFCIGKWMGKNPVPTSVPTPTPSASPIMPSEIPEESEQPAKQPEILAKSASGIYGGKADAHSVEIEFSDGSFESFSVADGFFAEIAAAKIKEGDNINFKYIEQNGIKIIIGIN